jgi:hypothetical protein
VGRRRRRRARRDANEQRGTKVDKRTSRSEGKRREAFTAQQRSLARRRTFVGALGFIPLVGALGCGSGVQFLCTVPQEWWLAIWAALFGSFLGLTIRLILERRKFARGAASG